MGRRCGDRSWSGLSLGRPYPGPHPASPEGYAGLTTRLREKREREEGAVRDWSPDEHDSPVGEVEPDRPGSRLKVRSGSGGSQPWPTR